MSPFLLTQHFNGYRLNYADRLIGREKAEVVVAIGASTGGPKVVEKIFTDLPADLPAAVMVSLHMPAGFTASFASRLDQISPLQVKEAEENDRLLEGVALIAPGNYHLIERRRAVALSSAPKVHFVRPAIDVMLNSLAFSKHKVVAVILSGMGRDGTAGVQVLKERKPGSIVIVQDPQTSIIPSMPESVIAEGCFDEVVPFPEIAGRIVKHARDLAAGE
ncbi:MAG TPA: CheB methylesterase domain-containing protein [Bacillota bacterium]|nr:CheB methylesterase domain-containing protein [Bacillota bacterium]